MLDINRGGLRAYLDKRTAEALSDEALTEAQKREALYRHRHCYRDVNIAVDIARSIGMSEEEQSLVYASAMLHDIGQIILADASYDTVAEDLRRDHGELGAALLKSDPDFINLFDSEEDFNIVYEAIRNHSKFKIDPSITDERTLTFCQILRDADKIDIMAYCLGEGFYEHTVRDQDVPNEETVQILIKDAQDHEQSFFKGLKDTTVGHVTFVIGLVLDLQFPRSYEIFQEEGYLDKGMTILRRSLLKSECEAIEAPYKGFMRNKLASLGARRNASKIDHTL